MKFNSELQSDHAVLDPENLQRDSSLLHSVAFISRR